MSTLGAKNIADISAEEITSAVNQVRNPSPIAANNVPASVLTAPQAPEVMIPEAQTPQVNAGAAIASAEQLTGSIQEQEAQRREQDVAQAGAVVSESERRLREGMGILGTESATRTRMEEESGLNDAQKQLNQMSNQLFNQTAEIRQFDVDNTNTIEQMRVDASRRDITKRTFGAMSAEAGIQMAVQRANMVGELYATQSSVQLMQGNIELATKSIDKALQAMYEPVRQEMQLEMMFYQRNGQLFDAAQNRAANARMEAIKQEQATMDRAQDAVTRVTEMGYATPGEIQEMMKAETPFEQTKIAREIYARGAMQERQMDMALRQAQLAKIYSDLAPRPQDDDMERKLSINELEQLNNMGYKLPMGSTVGDAINAGVVPGQGTGEPSEFARMVIDNPALISDLTLTERGNVYKEIAAAGGQVQTQAQQSAINISKKALNSVNDILASDDDSLLEAYKKNRQLKSGTGMPALTNILRGSGGRQFATKLDTLKAQLELPNLEFLAGMGRMSQEQFKTLQQASSNLDRKSLNNAEMRRQLTIVRSELKSFITEAEKKGSGSINQTGDSEYQNYLQRINQ
jgi:hypothetical protein